MTNPFHTANPTSLSKLSEHDWRVLSAHHSMFSAYSFVSKLGRKWITADSVGAVLFKTKSAAADHVTNLILAESRWRAHQRWEAENAAA